MNNYINRIEIRRILYFLTCSISVAIIVVGLSLTARNPVSAQTDFEIVAEFPAEHPPGNIAVTPDGRLIMSQHQF